MGLFFILQIILKLFSKIFFNHLIYKKKKFTKTYRGYFEQ